MAEATQGHKALTLEGASLLLRTAYAVRDTGNQVRAARRHQKTGPKRRQGKAGLPSLGLRDRSLNLLY